MTMQPFAQPYGFGTQKQPFGSEIEQIARQSIGMSQQRMDNVRGLIQMFVRAQKQPRTGSRGNGPPVGMNSPNLRANLGKIGHGRGAVGPIRPNARIVTIRDGQGHSVQVNKSVADDFKRFLKALKRTGYDIDSIGGYANRNIAGTSTRSLHSYGLAIDINPSANPVSYGHRVTNLPKGIGKLARRYGITWGGNWHGSKKDTMHFSFPYFGTK